MKAVQAEKKTKMRYNYKAHHLHMHPIFSDFQRKIGIFLLRVFLVRSINFRLLISAHLTEIFIEFENIVFRISNLKRYFTCDHFTKIYGVLKSLIGSLTREILRSYIITHVSSRFMHYKLN